LSEFGGMSWRRKCYRHWYYMWISQNRPGIRRHGQTSAKRARTFRRLSRTWLKNRYKSNKLKDCRKGNHRNSNRFSRWIEWYNEDGFDISSREGTRLKMTKLKLNKSTKTRNGLLIFDREFAIRHKCKISVCVSNGHTRSSQLNLHSHVRNMILDNSRLNQAYEVLRRKNIRALFERKICFHFGHFDNSWRMQVR